MRNRDRLRLMEEANLRLENSYLKSKGLIKEEEEEEDDFSDQPTLFPAEDMDQMIDKPEYRKNYWSKERIDQESIEIEESEKIQNEIEEKYFEELESLIQKQLQIKDEIVRTYGEEGLIFTDLIYWLESEYYGHESEEELNKDEEEEGSDINNSNM